LTAPAICVECRMTAIATPPGDSETNCSYVECDRPSVGAKFAQNKSYELRITAKVDPLIFAVTE